MLYIGKPVKFRLAVRFCKLPNIYGRVTIPCLRQKLMKSIPRLRLNPLNTIPPGPAFFGRPTEYVNEGVVVQVVGWF